MKIIAVTNQKVRESKTTCPKGVFTEGEFLKIVGMVDQETKKRQQRKPNQSV